MTRHFVPGPVMDRRLTLVLRRAVKELGLSARTYARVLTMSRTFAACANAKQVCTSHLLDAIQFCTLSETLARESATGGES